MNAAVVNAFDEPPRYTTFADPVAAEGEVPVSVTAAGLHPVVKALASGSHYGSSGKLPFVPGLDGVGRLEDGSRVYFGMARGPFGSFAERSLAANWMCIPVPPELDDATVAGIANPAMSSWMALRGRARFVAGENVLILGATGVAGQLAVQIAKRLGAKRVVGVGRNPVALEKLKHIGADAVISLGPDDGAAMAAIRNEYTTGGIQVVLDYLWGPPAEWVLEAIGGKGLKPAASGLRFIQIGEGAGQTIRLAAATLRSSRLELSGSGSGSANLEQIRREVEEFFKMAAKKPFQFNVRKVPLSEVESAWNSREPGSRVVFQP